MLPMAGCVVASSRGLSAVAAGTTDTQGTRAVVERFLDLLYRRRQARAAFESCVVASGFRDHVGGGRGSRAAAAGLLAERFSGDGLQVSVERLVVEGDTAMVHLRCRDGSAPQIDRVEIYRVLNDRIVEHWSVCAAPAPPP
jgi:predicted SnoaL-like aldol condensation-catalyzing enzyme